MREVILKFRKTDRGPSKWIQTVVEGLTKLDLQNMEMVSDTSQSGVVNVISIRGTTKLDMLTIAGVLSNPLIAEMLSSVVADKPIVVSEELDWKVGVSACIRELQLTVTDLKREAEPFGIISDPDVYPYIDRILGTVGKLELIVGEVE